MHNIFKRAPLYVKIYTDRIEITNLKTGKTVSGRPLQKYSNSHMVVAEFNIADKLIKELVKELDVSAQLKMLVQQMKLFEQVICESEKRILRDLCEQAGAVSVMLVTNDKPLSNEEALDVIQNLKFSRQPFI